MTATREIQDFSSDARDFDKQEWIKQNRKYPADPLAELRAYRDYLYEIPQKYRYHLIPERTFNIIEFTELKLPGTTSTLIEYAAKNCFSSLSCLPIDVFGNIFRVLSIFNYYHHF